MATSERGRTATDETLAGTTPSALLDLRLPSDASISPDGRAVVYVLAAFLPDQPKRRSRLWLVETAGGVPRPLTQGTSDDTQPRWSPDGKQIAFISTRDDPQRRKGQLYVTPTDGGAARRVCALPNGASDPAWSPDGASLAFLSLEGPEPPKDPITVHEDRHRRLWRVRVGEGEEAPEPVTPADLSVWEYAWSPDGERFAVFSSEGPGETDWYRGQLGVVPARGGAVRPLLTLSRQAAALTWANDGQHLAYISGEWSDRGLVGGDIFVVPTDGGEGSEGGEARNLTPGAEISYSWCQWLPGGRELLYAAWEGVTASIGLLAEEQGQTTRTVLDPDFTLATGHQPRLSLSSDGTRLAAIATSNRQPPEIYAGTLERGAGKPSLSWRRLTTLNPLPEETWTHPATERITYPGADGLPIHALFTPPLTAKRGTPPPLVVDVHGGPSSAWTDDFLGGAYTRMLAGAGFAVLRPNIRGSQGRGVAFSDMVLGDMGGKDLEDVLAGVDYLVRQGRVDGERVGISGWSYGGFMTAWAVSQTDRFRAAVMGAGICDFHSFHAESNIPDWDMRFLAAHPHEAPEVYRERSAITHARRITTPTLILHGEKDPCVPLNQANAFYRALRERGVRVELAVYPREGHGILEREHLRDRNERVLRWFERWL